MDILEKLFGNSVKVKIMKLFLFHPDSVFDIEKIRKKTQVTVSKARREVTLLEKMGFLKRRVVHKERAQKRAGAKNTKKVTGWVLDPDFPYLEALQKLLVYTSPFANKDIIKKLQGAGSLKLVTISGIFLQDWESRVDLLVVGDSVKMNNLYSIIRTLEADLGKELRYSIFETSDFLYRVNMCDKLVRDILDYPHEKILNKLDI